MKFFAKVLLLICGLCIFTVSFDSTRASTIKIPLDRIELTEESLEYTGKQCKPEFTVYDIYGNTVDNNCYTFEYINAVNVSDKKAELYIKAKDSSDYQGSLTQFFSITPVSIEDAITQVSDKTYTGSAITPSVKVILNGKKLSSSNYTLSYSNNINAGTATVTVTGIGNYSGSVSADFTINPKKATPSIQLSQTRYVYDATRKKPEVTSVTVGSDKIPLETSEYTVKFSSGRKKAGTYSVTVTLKGNYNGTATKKFVIEQENLKNATVTLSKETYTYSGKAFKPSVKVKVNGLTLKKGTDYTVTYSSNKNVGYGDVQVKGIGNYKGKSAKEKFLIRKDIQQFNVTVKDKSFSVSHSKLKKAAQTLPASKTLKITDYIGDITYSIGYVAGRKYFSINQSTGAITVAKGTPKGTYNLTLKLCADGDDGHMLCYRLADVNIKVS